MADGATDIMASSPVVTMHETIDDGRNNTAEAVEVVSDIYSTVEPAPGNTLIPHREADERGGETATSEQGGKADLPAKQESIVEPNLAKDDAEKMPAELQAAKVSGYLAKKGKMRMVSSWKKYWFVLDSRLLLYYRSKAEYDALGPCKGSITLGSPCTIKPGSASNCVFQIETRNHTVTLRAENRAEQDKWMHAILSALKQTSQTARMSHFRYSADDLAVRAHADKSPMPLLIRQNTMPDRVPNSSAAQQTARKNEPAKTMLERIEAMGGQSYIPVIADHVKASKASPKLPKNTNLKKLLDKQISIVSAKNEQGSWIKEEDVDAETVENDLYDSCDTAAVKDAHIYQEIPDTIVVTEVMVENTTYVDIDQNKNNVEYWEPIYATAKAIDDRGMEPTLPSTVGPEEAPIAPDDNDKLEKKDWQKLAKMVKEDRKAGAKRQSFVFRMFKKIKRQESSGKDNGKGKQKEEETLENLEKEVDAENGTADEHALVINELCPDVMAELTAAIQLKEKGDSAIGDIAAVPEENAQSDNEEATAQTEPAPTQLEQLSQLQQPQLPLKQTTNDDVNMENPSQENQDKKEANEEQTKDPHNKEQEEENHHSDFDYDIYDTSQRLNIPRPKLICKPKRQKRFQVAPEVPLTTSKMKKFIGDEDPGQVVAHPREDKLMTIDEILDDLDNQHYEPFSRQKVKDLIEKFNETEQESDEDTKEEKEIHVKLIRQRSEPSEELSSLLDELSKVANLSMTSPDRSNYMDNEPYSVEEWKSIIPIRKRRHSDPDYDIPRPHSALQILANNDNDENKMQPTRFFGPVIIDHIHGDTTSCGTSITPDSLEVDALIYNAKNYTPSIEEDRSMRSYTSHVYTSKELHSNINSANNKLNVEGECGGNAKEDIQPQPKPLSPLIAPKTESEQAFYLNAKCDNNNNDKKLEAIMIYDETHPLAPKIDLTVGGISNSVCYDSLEPFSDESK